MLPTQSDLSPLQTERMQYVPKFPEILEDIGAVDFASHELAPVVVEIQGYFPRLSQEKAFEISKQVFSKKHKLRVGVVLSGGQAPGGHNVISGLFDALKELDSESTLFGFLQGPQGIIQNQYKEITGDELLYFRNQGGFDLIGSGRTKIETEAQFFSSLNTVKLLRLDGLVIVGGDDSNTNAAYLAEYFLQHGCTTTVVGVPKTIDGDLQSADLEISFGFDTASKIYSETIGNIARDAKSAKKYYYFIKLMGRSASHITLECALKTHPNLALISEEIEAKRESLTTVIDRICDLVVERAKKGKNFGVLLIPEGIVEFLPDCKALIQELNRLLAKDTTQQNECCEKFETLGTNQEKIAYISSQLTDESRRAFHSFPQEIQTQLLDDRDPHGNVQVSKIQTEKLFIRLVEQELKKRSEKKEYTGKFAGISIFCGYEGRSGLPSSFDCDYCYSLGKLAASLILRKKTGYMVAIKHTALETAAWIPIVIPLISLMHLEERSGKRKPVIKKALVNLTSHSYKTYERCRDSWKYDDFYLQPGPIQFSGPLTETRPESLILDRVAEFTKTYENQR